MFSSGSHRMLGTGHRLVAHGGLRRDRLVKSIGTQAWGATSPTSSTPSSSTMLGQKCFYSSSPPLLRSSASPLLSSAFPATNFPLHYQFRSFADGPSRLDKMQGNFKQLIPPQTIVKRETIIEPPVRTRPFRPFRGARIKANRSPPKRVPVPESHAVERGDYGSYPVQAIHAAQTIDLAAVVSKVFATKGIKKILERSSVVVQLPMDEQFPTPRFVAVFRFGSVVFFNVAPRDAIDLLGKIKKCSSDPVMIGVERKESFCVHVHPDYFPEEEEKVVTGEYCVVQELNMKSVDVISNVMAQSVALDAYNDMVDDLLARFAFINGTVRNSGSLTTVERDSLFKTVAQNNSIFIDMVSKLGIKDRSDTAWNLSQYEEIHEGMKSEFEINLRFRHIEFKLDLIQTNAKFFLEVIHHQKSSTLEWIIIVLIAFECGLMGMDMSGYGPVFFQTLAKLYPFP